MEERQLAQSQPPQGGFTPPRLRRTPSWLAMTIVGLLAVIAGALLFIAFSFGGNSDTNAVASNPPTNTPNSSTGSLSRLKEEFNAMGGDPDLDKRKLDALDEELKLKERQREIERRQRELEQEEMRRKEGLALATTRLKEIAGKAEEILRLVGEFEAEHETWNKEVIALLTNERGKAIAGQEHLVAAFAVHFDKPRPHPTEAQAIRTRVESLLLPVHEALSDDPSTYSASSAVQERLEREKQNVLSLISAYKEPRKKIEALAAVAATSGSPAEFTLERAISDKAEREARELALAVQKEREQAQKQVKEMVAAAEAEAVLQEGKNREAKIKAETEAAKIRSELEVDSISDAAERDRLHARAKSKEVHELLFPFFAEGYWQPGDRDENLGIEKMPMSLSRMRAYGALQQTRDGLLRLYECGNACWTPHQAHRDKTRPKWGFSCGHVKLKPEEFEQIKKAQDYLIELGDTFVELQMLSP